MPHMQTRVACLAVAVLAWASPGAGAQPPAAGNCPLKIEVEQRLASVPEGWEGGRATVTVALASVAFFDGPPAEKVALKFDSEDRQKRDRIAFWKFPPSARGYWMSCNYVGTTAVISRRLPNSVKYCAVTYERKRLGASGQPAVKHIDCR